MSGVLAVREWGAPTLAPDHLARMMGALTRRGDRTALWQGDGIAVGTSHFDWELGDGFRGDAGIARTDRLVVAADASLYYRRDLVKALEEASASIHGLTASNLILSAYEAWGERCVDHLEGDYAFVVFDAERSRIVAARDPMGRRPLFFATFGAAVVVASTSAAVLAHPRASHAPNIAALIGRMSFGVTDEASSPYADVTTLPAGHVVVMERGASAHVSRYWSVPSQERHVSAFDDAVMELRELVASAVIERMDPGTPTSIWLSGGYDSTSIFGIAERALGERGDGRRLSPISMSYPIGDHAREDEIIGEVTGFWQTTPRWVQIEDVPLLAKLPERAAGQDEPFPHAFENWTHAMLDATRASGSHVALTGDGGDQLFAVSNVFMLDLLARGHWTELRREWNAFGPQGYRAFFRDVVRPVVETAANRMRGDRTPEYQPPAWVRSDVVKSSGYLDREWKAEQWLASQAGSRERKETLLPLLSPVTARVAASTSNFALDYGVEVRVPLLDRRVIDFAARRPREERASAGSVKHLLRAAAVGALPPAVLAPRATRTGTLGHYFARELRADRYGIVTDAFHDPVLADLGIVDKKQLSDAWIQYRTSGDATVGARLFLTLQVELWLKSQPAVLQRSCTQLAESADRSEAVQSGTGQLGATRAHRSSELLRPALPLRPSWP